MEDADLFHARASFKCEQHTVDINSLKLISNESLEGIGEGRETLATAVLLNSLLELLNCDLTVLKF